MAHPTAPRSDAECAETTRDIAALLSTPYGIRDVAMALRSLADSLDTLVAAAPLRPRDLCDLLAVREKPGADSTQGPPHDPRYVA